MAAVIGRHLRSCLLKPGPQPRYGTMFD